MAKKQLAVTPVTPEQKPQLMKGSDTVKPIHRNLPEGDAELPVQKPGAGEPVQTLSTPAKQNVPTTTQYIPGAPAADPAKLPGGSSVPETLPASTPAADTTPAANDIVPDASNGYKSLNDQIFGEGGTGQKGYDQQVAALQQTGAAKPYTDEDLRRQLIAAGVDPATLYEYSHKGGYTQNRDTALAGGGTGNPVDNFYREGTWYYYPGTSRDAQAGTSGMDASALSDASYAYVQFCKQMYDNASTAEEKAYWHNEAEKTRARAGYSGSIDGSMAIPLAQLEIEQAQQELLGGGGTGIGGNAGAGGSSGGSSYPDTPEGRMQAILDEWKYAAEQQANGQINYAVEQAIKELERALQDAQPQFKEQAESVSLDERQALDNSALYAELRGDRGGIGQEQYNSIQNTAAQNRLAVQQAQTKLSTDTARQIEDLRAQGEFEKADKALEITQQYLAQLVSLEQWAAEFGLTQQQFQAQLQQWEAEYNMALQQLQISQDQWGKEFQFAKDQFAYDQFVTNKQLQMQKDQFDYEVGQAALAKTEEQGWNLFNTGQISSLTDEQLKAMGFKTQADAQAMYDAMLLQSANSGEITPDRIYEAVFNSNRFTPSSEWEDVADYIQTEFGVTESDAEAYARQFIKYEYSNLYKGSEQNPAGLAPSPIGPGITADNAYRFGYLSWDSMKSAANNMTKTGDVIELFSRVYRTCNKEQLDYFYNLINSRTKTVEESNRFASLLAAIPDYNPYSKYQG